jgi:hypothetical protein
MSPPEPLPAPGTGERWVAPPPPEEGVISWNINTACNYRCSYCTQRFLEDRGRWSRDTPRFLAAFGRLPGRWEIKISGGEPFVHPTLTDLVEGLSGLSHRVSIVTNFSASLAKLTDFVRAARGRVGVFSCSLHLEYVEDVPAYIRKAQQVSELLQQAADPALPRPSLNVTTVATRSALPCLPALAAQFAAHGVTFKVQPEKQDGANIDYSKGEAQVLVQLGGHNRTGSLAHRYAGRPCWSGSRYFIVDDKGVAYRCYPARRQKTERLGDFLSPEFRLFDGPAPCRYAACYCTVPIERGLMSRQPAAAPPNDSHQGPHPEPAGGVAP